MNLWTFEEIKERTRNMPDSKDRERMCRLVSEVTRLREALKEIAHAPEYKWDSTLCPDPDDCSGCFASKVLRDGAMAFAKE